MLMVPTHKSKEAIGRMDQHADLNELLQLQKARSKKRKAMLESSSSDEDDQPLKRRTVARVDQSDDGASSCRDTDFVESVAVKSQVVYEGSSNKHKVGVCLDELRTADKLWLL